MATFITASRIINARIVAVNSSWMLRNRVIDAEHRTVVERLLCERISCTASVA
jgi:hypothetical protein